MQSWMRIVALASLAAAGACSARRPPAAVPPAITNAMPARTAARDLQIRLHQDVGLLTETETVLLRGDGTFERETRSKATGLIIGRSHGSVDPSQIEALASTMLANGFLELPDFYPPRPSLARRPDGTYVSTLTLTTDGTCTELSLHLGEWQKRTRECNTAPEPLKQLYAAVWKLVKGARS